MTFVDHASFSFPPAFAPAALTGAAIVATALLARPRAVEPVFVQRRLGQVPNNLFFQKAVKRQAPAALALPRPSAA